MSTIDILEQTTDILKEMANTLTGLTAISAGHEVRLLKLEGKEVPPEMWKTYVDSQAKAAEIYDE